jgi:tetratricopeptide (TPR) repeat protein
MIPLLLCMGCSGSSERPKVALTAEEFRHELVKRAPELAGSPVSAPFEIDRGAIYLARKAMRRAEYGLPRIEAVVDMLHRDPPEGLGLRYAAAETTQNASETLKLRRGNCMALASVLVGLGRALGWPVYYAEASVRDEEIHREGDLVVRADHMVVVIATQTVRAVVDFTGPVEHYRVNIIDDLHAYAHHVNNRTAEQMLAQATTTSPSVWEQALEGFTLAASIHPEMSRAWNNRGVALARLGRLDEARASYDHAFALDPSLDSPQRQNLIALETRARGEASVSGSSPPLESGR